VVIGVLALGLGANVSVFSLFQSLALTPVAGVEASGRLGVLAARTSAGRILPLSYPDYTDLAADHRGIAAVAGTTIGQRVRLADADWAEVVGVVRDIKYTQLNEKATAYLYFPVTQYALANLFAHVRVRESTPAVTERLRSVVQAMDPGLAVQTQPMKDQTELGLAVYGLAAGILATFGGIAGLLAALGIYGLVAYAARQSAHEIGIRVAIGATRSDVIRQFLNRGLTLGAAGAVIGVLLSLAVGRLLASVLYGVTATDPAAFTAASVSVLAVVLAASIVPAWRASRTNAATALRQP
jgi:predicted lysophospholipase L1 biosynthesis ABC-type transport system permease subunit